MADMDRQRASRSRGTRIDSAADQPVEAVEAAAETPAVDAPVEAAQSAEGGPIAAAEIELKLSIGAEDARRLGRLPAVRRSMRGRARTQTLHSVYYDTPR